MQAEFLTPTVVVIMVCVGSATILAVTAMITKTPLSATFEWFKGAIVNVGNKKTDE